MCVLLRVCLAIISIHALLAESDKDIVYHKYNDDNFYPRSPCGERREFKYELIRKI